MYLLVVLLLLNCLGFWWLHCSFRKAAELWFCAIASPPKCSVSVLHWKHVFRTEAVVTASGTLYGRSRLELSKHHWSLALGITFFFSFCGCCQTAPRSVRVHIEYEDLSALKKHVHHSIVFLYCVPFFPFNLASFLPARIGQTVLLAFVFYWVDEVLFCIQLALQRGFKKCQLPFCCTSYCVPSRVVDRAFFKNGRYHSWILISCSFRPFLFVTLVMVMLNAVELGIFQFVAIVRTLDLLFHTSLILYIRAL